MATATQKTKSNGAAAPKIPLQQPIKGNPPVAEAAGGASPIGNDLKEQLYKTFNDALEKTKDEVKQLQEKLADYDKKLEASKTVKDKTQKASVFMNSTLEEIKATLENLSQKSKEVFLQSKDLAVETLTDLWTKLRSSIEKLQQLAAEFEDKYEVKNQISQLAAPVLARLKQFSGSLEKAGETAKELGKSGRSYLIGSAASLEHKYNIEARLQGLDEKYKISETAKSLQSKGEEFVEKQHIKERVLELDQKWTGAKGQQFVTKGVEIVKGEMEKVQMEYENAKQN